MSKYSEFIEHLCYIHEQLCELAGNMEDMSSENEDNFLRSKAVLVRVTIEKLGLVNEDLCEEMNINFYEGEEEYA